MNIGERDKRALIALGVVGVLIIGYAVFTTEDKSVQVVAAVDNIPSAENRLSKLRQIAASVPAREQMLAQVRTELAEREKGLIQAETAAQAQAQLVQVLRKVARSQTPPVDLRNTEMGQVRTFGSTYGEISVSASFECGIEQLLTLLAELTAQPQAIATGELRIGTANARQKTIPVRLTITGLVRGELVPDKKGTASL
jgi:hypothetical protein